MSRLRHSPVIYPVVWGEMPGNRKLPGTWRWKFAAWNAAVALWVVTGHASVKGTGGKGNILVTITLVIVWLVGNAAIGAAQWSTSRRR